MLTRRQLIASGTSLLLAGAYTRTQAQDAAQPQITSTRYISMNADTGAIFAQRDAHDQVAIASLTKIFTAMEALSIAPLNTEIVTTEDDLRPAEATVMGFGPGESFSLEELIYGMMLPSGNDAAYAIARTLGYREGDTAEEAVQRFMDLVNQRVLAMGLQNTHLLNPDGWGVSGHYSSAADVAAFMAYACGSDFLLEVMGTQSYTTSSGYQLVNTNKVLSSAPSVLGGKTGYDDDSGWCLVQIAQRESTRIVAVTLDGVALVANDWYSDNLVLLDYGFEQQETLGSQPFEGEIMSWSDPAPVLFAESGSGEVSLTGETEDRETVATREEPSSLPERITDAPPPAEPIALDGHRGSGALAGIGATLLAGAMAASRWLDLGGAINRASLQSGMIAIGGSLKRAVPLPSLPSRSSSQSANNALPPIETDASDDPLVDESDDSVSSKSTNHEQTPPPNR